ncbi:hypothetical protein Tco_0120987 [Tanacetum coccineum]
MGELTFFLGLQVEQKKDTEILKKFRFIEVKTASTPMETQKPLLKDEHGEEVDVHMYRSMIGSLMYLTSSRPDIMFAVCACARYQVNPKVSHLHAVKRIFRYLKGQPKLGFWYPKDSPFDLVAYIDSDYAGASLDRKSNKRRLTFYMISKGMCSIDDGNVVWNGIGVNADTHNMVAFLSKPIESDGFKQIVDFLNAHPIRYALTINPTIYTSCIKQFWSTVKANTINGKEQLHALVDGKKIIITELSVRRYLQLADEEGVDCLLNSTIFEQLTLMGPKTTAWNEFSSTMASAIICLATNQKFNDSKFIFESMIRNLDNLSDKFLMYPSTLERKRVQWGREKGSLRYEFEGDKRGDSDLTLVTWCLVYIRVPRTLVRDPNQHLKDFLKLVYSLDLDVANRERTRLRLFQFSLRNQASDWLEHLPARSISTWEDLTTRFLALRYIPSPSSPPPPPPLSTFQPIPIKSALYPRRTTKLRNDILMFQQHQGEYLSEAQTCFKDLL